MVYLTVVTFFRHFADTPTSLDRINLLVENVKTLSLETEVLIVEAPPYVLKDSIRLRAGFRAHLGLNAAIRRAKGEYILLTSRDTVFNPDLMRFFESRKLKPRIIYRIDRKDVRPAEKYGSVEEMQKYCASNTYRINSRWDVYRPHDIPAILARVLARLYFAPFPVPYTNASGDFLLMHRDDWFRLRGFPEIVNSGIHLDSFVVYSAIYSGMRQVILKDPLKLYHIEHPRTPAPSSPHMLQVLDAMRRLRKPIVLNDEDWGMHENLLV